MTSLSVAFMLAGSCLPNHTASNTTNPTAVWFQGLLIWRKIIHCISLLKVSIANGTFDDVCNVADQSLMAEHHFEHLHKPVIDPPARQLSVPEGTLSGQAATGLSEAEQPGHSGMFS